MNRHPLMDALIAELPELGSVWPKEQRQKWLSAATAILDLVYPAVQEQRDVNKHSGPLTGPQTSVLEFIASKSPDGEFAEISQQQMAQGSGVALGSLGFILGVLGDRGLIESQPGNEPRSAKKYRAVPTQ